MEWYNIGLLMIIAVIFFVLSGIPIGITLVGIGLAFLFPALGFVKTTVTVGNELWNFWTSWSLLPIALFILMGEFLFVGGAAKDIFDIAAKWLQRLPGGLAVVSTAACAIFASMCGSSGGAVATMSVIAIPEMQKRNYSNRLSCGTVAAAGCLAHLIPPSVLMIVYASIAEISPGQALMSAMIPGFSLALLYILTVFIWVSISPNSAPREMQRVPLSEKFRSLLLIWQPAVIIFAVIGTIYNGVATATEASALGALASMIIALIKRRLNWTNFRRLLLETAQMTCFILFIAVGGKVLSLAMTYFLIPQYAVEFIVEQNLLPINFVFIMMLVYLILGCFLDPIGMMVITLPVVTPILKAMDLDLYWFGVLLMINFEMALITPPYGAVIYIIKGIHPNIPLGEIIQGGLCFFPAIILLIMILTFFPELALWLPRNMMR